MVSDKTSILDLQIHTFAPMQDGQPYLAKIGRVGTMPMLFTGSSAIMAFAAADNWRRAEMAKFEKREGAYRVFPKAKEAAE